MKLNRTYFIFIAFNEIFDTTSLNIFYQLFCKKFQDSVSKSSDTSGDTTDKPKNISKLSQRVKKKSWYSPFYPCYKTRSDDFKKLFKEVSTDERLVVGKFYIMKT